MKHAALASFCLCLSILPVASALAQEADTDLEEIVVTGSRIRGTGPVGSNVIALGEKQVLQQPAATITEYLRTIPQIQGFGVDASSAVVAGGQGGTNTTRGSAINLRGLGPQATLTLIDGERLSFSGVAGNYVDATTIPAIAIERIEVVADGASAVYGSDAVAGVVNFLLRKKFDGVQVRARYGQADEYWSSQYGFLAGKDWGSGSVVVAFERGEHDNLNGGERDYIRSDLRALGGSDYRNSSCNPGSIVAVTGAGAAAVTARYAIPAGGVTSANQGSLVAGTRNFCENLRFGDILPEERRNSVYGYFQQDITDALNFHVQGLATNRSYTAQAVSQGSTSNLQTISVPVANAFRPTMFAGVTTLSVEYDWTRDFGLVNQTGYTHTNFLTAGFDYDVTENWRASLTGVYSTDDSGQWTRRINQPVLTQRLNSADPAFAFNPFGGANSQATLDAIFTGVFNPYAVSRTAGGGVQLDGKLWTLPGGDLRVALGGERLTFATVGSSLQGSLVSPAFLTAKLQRRQNSVFAELFVPLFGAGNEITALRRLDLSAAVRHDKYSDVGGTTNPKFGVNWSPMQGLLLKGSYGTSFRAPGLQDLPVLRAGAGITSQPWTDPVLGGSTTGYIVNAGSPNLTPEEATTWSFTAEFTPEALPGLRASATYFSIEYTDLIGFPPRTTSSLLDANYAFAVTRNPTPAFIQSFLDKGLTITGATLNNPPWLYDGSARNLGSVETKGVDLDLSYAFDTGVGDFTVGVNSTSVFNYDFAVTQLATPIDQAGNINYPVKFRARAYAGWNRGAWGTELAVNRVDSYNNNLITPIQSVSAWTTVDLHVGYEFQQESGVLSGLGLGFDATNLADKDAPFVNLQAAFDPGQASAMGRLLSVSLAKKF